MTNRKLTHALIMLIANLAILTIGLVKGIPATVVFGFIGVVLAIGLSIGYWRATRR